MWKALFCAVFLFRVCLMVQTKCVDTCSGNGICKNDTCECVKGYWGNPANGGKCEACECNGQATHCNAETGKCYCTTKGLIGDHCEKCDATNHYNFDPINKESCYYDLTIDYQFTFNLSKKEDRYFTHINFRNSPIKADSDADFHIRCSVFAKMNITIRRNNSKEEKPIFEELNCMPTAFQAKFPKSEFDFGFTDDVALSTFYVYVYNLKPPLWIEVAFSQYPKQVSSSSRSNSNWLLSTLGWWIARTVRAK